MTIAEPRRKANGDAAMRPWRIGTSSGMRDLACCSSSEIGSGRLGAGFHAPCPERGTMARNPFPAARRSASEAVRGGSISGTAPS